MKDFLSLASRRQSDRAFDTQRPVEKEKLQRILEAACIAPSACNSQPWHFVVVDDQFKVLALVELDDRTHSQPKDAKRALKRSGYTPK